MNDALALADAVKSGRVSAREALADALAKAEAKRELGAIRFMDPERAFRTADGLDALLRTEPERAASMPFFGVPFLMKDLGAPAAGFPVTCGSRLLADAAAPTENSELARRFLASGLVPFGVSTSSEFGLALSCEPAAGPIARNPLDPTLTPGGSSGGAAAAIGAGIVALAQSGDAFGSTRIPAACCGLVGLKPSRGAMPCGPLFGNHLLGLAGELVISRTIKDAAAALDAFSGQARGPEPDLNLGGAAAALKTSSQRLTIGVCDEGRDGMPISEARRRAVAEAAAALERDGHRVIPVDPRRLADLCERSERVLACVLSVNLARNLARFSNEEMQETEPLTRAMVARGRGVDGVSLLDAQAQATLVAHDLWRLFDEMDALLTPMLAGPPPPIGSFPMDHEDVEAHWRRSVAFAPYVALANVSGGAAISVPMGLDGEGLPLPLQIVGPMGSDARLLSLAGDLVREEAI